MNPEELLKQLVEIFSKDRNPVLGMTAMDYFAAHAPPMAQFWRAKYIEQAKVDSMSQENLNVEARWRWAYARAMVQSRPQQSVERIVNGEEIVRLEEKKEAKP